MQKISQPIFQQAKEYGQQIANGLNTAVTNYHAVNYGKDLLRNKGFIELKEM